MSYKSLNQKGFGAMETLLAIIILAIVAGTGYYVYNANKKTTDTQNAAHQAAESAAVNKAADNKSAVAAGAQAKQVYVNLLKAYNKNGAAHADWDVTYVNSQAAAAEFTTDFKAAVKDGTAWPDGVFCTDKYTFESFLVDKTNLEGDTATVALAPTINGKKSSAYPMNIQLTLQYADKQWAIDKQTCVAS